MHFAHRYKERTCQTMQKQLQEYLNSDRFYIEREDYLWQYDHFQEDEPEYPEDPPIDTYFKSNIYMEIEARVKAESGYQVRLSDTAVQKIFTRGYCDTQLFAVVFGIWYGLTNAQLKPIRNLRNHKWCLQYLDFFVCNPERQALNPDEIEMIRMQTLERPISWQKNVRWKAFKKSNIAPIVSTS